MAPGGKKTDGESSEALQSRTRQPLHAVDLPYTTRPTGRGPKGQQWIAPYLIAYLRCYGERASPPAVRRIAKGMHELERVFPRAEIIARWGRYLMATELRWYSVERFGETYPRWGAPAPAADHRPDMYLTLEEQEARRAAARTRREE